LGNPDLDPYTNTSWEIGTEWQFLDKQMRVKATYFQNDFDDIISKVERYSSIRNQIVRTYFNVAEAEVEGIELALEANLPWNLKGGIHYAHNWSEYDDPNDELGKDGWIVDQTPEDVFNFWLGYFSRFWDASVNLRYSDIVYDDQKNPYSSDVFKDYTDSFIVDAQVTFRPVKKLSLTLSVDNLFDEEYYEYYVQPGRTILGTINLSF
jgi:iron complex outermembrane receptor protein